jgi:hypothetical protein
VNRVMNRGAPQNVATFLSSRTTVGSSSRARLDEVGQPWVS